ncbi:MAG: inorganic phosphate transporter [Verrucomicrobia bacterium]|nr:inorganic phosphate transporter [Verrucomicrobiota bacterium]
MTLVLTVIFVALVFEYINGFHDTANSIATVVSTKVLSPRQAVLLAASTNLLGALFGAAVAKTISSGLVDAKFVSSEVLICALLAAIIWNLLTWYFGLPSSSTHALVGGLCGAALGAAHGSWAAIKWIEIKTKVVTEIDPATQQVIQKTVTEKAGVYYKVILPMISSPVAGFAIGLLVMTLLYLLLRRWRPATVARVFGKLQLLSAGYMGFSHGLNDAQKTMGIIALALVAATGAGTFHDIPGWLSFLKITPPAAGKSLEIPVWIKIVCALTMAAGTAAGGWRIIRTLGHKMVKLQPVHGFAAETTAATVLYVAGMMGMPVSTTHAITTSIMGVGCAKRFSKLNLGVAERIIWTWILTLPVTGVLAYLLVRFCQMVHWIP